MRSRPVRITPGMSEGQVRRILESGRPFVIGEPYPKAPRRHKRRDAPHPVTVRQMRRSSNKRRG